MYTRALVVLAALLGSACSVPNKSHCGNLTGDAICAERDKTRPYCDLCTAVNDGCVAEPPQAMGCAMASDSGAASSTGTPATSTDPTTGAPGTTTGTTTGMTTGTGTTTGTSTTDSTGTGTTESTSTGTGTSTTETTSTSTDSGTTEMSSGTDTSSGTTGGPMCGNGVIDPGETCDGANLNNKGCADFPNLYGGGTLACNPDCKAYDFGECCLVKGQGCLNNKDCCSNMCLITCG